MPLCDASPRRRSQLLASPEWWHEERSSPCWTAREGLERVKGGSFSRRLPPRGPFAARRPPPPAPLLSLDATPRQEWRGSGFHLPPHHEDVPAFRDGRRPARVPEAPDLAAPSHPGLPRLRGAGVGDGAGDGCVPRAASRALSNQTARCPLCEASYTMRGERSGDGFP